MKIENKNLGNFAIDREIIEHILDDFRSVDTILELGSGTGTKELVKFFNVYSVEDDEEWVGFVSKSNYIHAPIKDYGNYRWYDVDVLKEELPDEYGLILVDGPLGSIGREGFLYNVDLFRNVPIIFDDTNREKDLQTAMKVAKKLNKSYKHISSSGKKSKKKQFTVIEAL